MNSHVKIIFKKFKIKSLKNWFQLQLNERLTGLNVLMVPNILANQNNSTLPD